MKKSILLILLLATIYSAKAQDEKFKALFIYNFTKYIEWPSNKKTGDFIIAIYGKDPIKQELEVIAQKKTVGVQKMIIKEVNDLSECSGCHILYIPEKKSSSAESILKSITNKGVIVITNKNGLAKNISGINFVSIDGKQQFEINKRHIEAQGASVNSGLLSLGIIVE